jgi:HEPN domain-containing protein
VRFPYVHDLALLLDLVEKAGQNVSEAIKHAARLSDYAVETRYPDISEPVTQAEYEKAVTIAEQVVRWAEDIVGRDEPEYQ